MQIRTTHDIERLLWINERLKIEMKLVEYTFELKFLIINWREVMVICCR